jgi:hypothetical protein
VHAALEELLETAAHYVGVFPVIRGTRGIAREGTYKGAVFNASDIVRRRASVIASGPLFLIEARESAGGNEPIAEKVILRLRTIDPVD